MTGGRVGSSIATARRRGRVYPAPMAKPRFDAPIEPMTLGNMRANGVRSPILFDDHDKASADAARTSIVATAKRFIAAGRKAAAKRTDDGLPVHSFRSLLGDLVTVTHNTMAMAGQPDATFALYPNLTPVQARAFQLLDVTVNL
jgi:hypothetical protein